eukprot:352945-Chlamydomonas_euryale.AAC.2
MSGTLLVPDIVRLYPRMSPGFCDAQYGAVENIDWRDRWRVGTERNAQQPLRTKRTIALYDGCTGAGRRPQLACEQRANGRTLAVAFAFPLCLSMPNVHARSRCWRRCQRSMARSPARPDFRATAAGTCVASGGSRTRMRRSSTTPPPSMIVWNDLCGNQQFLSLAEIKQALGDTSVWCVVVEPAPDVRSGRTQAHADMRWPHVPAGIADTSSGYTDEVGNVIGAGENWRHRRVCTDPDECYTDYFLHRDNCYVSRTAVFDQNTSTWSLSDCVFSGTGQQLRAHGSSAYLNPALGEQGPTFNETSYYNQFAANLSEYPWYGSVAVMSAEDHLERNYLTYQQGYGSDNITNYSYSKVKITFNDYTLNVAVEVRS